jgi:hypothetical protein
VKTAIGLCIAFALATTGAQAQKAGKLLPVVAEQDRQVSGGRAVQLTLRQTQIETSIDIGRVANYNYAYYDYGIWSPFFGDVDDDMHDMLRKAQRDKAEATVVPLRKALAGFDVDAVALAATSAALAKPDWFQPQTIIVAKDTEGEARVAFLASSDAPQFASIWYRYELSPDFSQIRVIAEVTLMRRRRAGDAGSDPLTPIYRQRILSAVQLRTRSYEPRENVASWSAENGKLARAALTAAFGQFESLLPYALGLGRKDLDVLADKRHEKAFAAGFYGALIARNPNNPDDILIWANGLIHVQSTP